MKNNWAHPAGINIFAALIILSSIGQLIALLSMGVDFSDYEKYLVDWPKNLIVPRYIFSIAQRVIGISAAVGVIYRSDFCRKLLIFIGVYTLCIVYWKHPPYIVEDIVRKYIAASPELMRYDFNIPLVSWITWGLMVLWEFIFWGISIFYLTRLRVKAYFH